ncbi:MAG: protease pro-enzyme activation domain-containing protein [Limisphaerales bacterium]
MSKIKGVPVSSGLGVLLLLTATFSTFGAAGPRHFINGLIPQAVTNYDRLTLCPQQTSCNWPSACRRKTRPGSMRCCKKSMIPPAPNYRHYLTPEQFAESFGPTTADYQAVIDFAKANGLKITGTHPNRLVLDVAGSVADMKRHFR